MLNTRQEYPRPQLERQAYLMLNGEWTFDFDDTNRSIKEKWYSKEKNLSRKINVPYAYESQLSGIGELEPHNYVFYKRKIDIPKAWVGKNIILHFGAVDYRCEVFINECKVGEHVGGNVSFSFDITHYLTYKEDTVSVYVQDVYDDETQPRGKQYWKEKSESIWYTRTTGIWQSVWLEPVAKQHIQNVYFTPDIDRGLINVEYEISQVDVESTLEVEILFREQILIKDTIHLVTKNVRRAYDVIQNKIFNTNAHGDGCFWTPENPNLYDIRMCIKKENTICDEVKSYFGMRKIHIENGITYLNNRPYYFRLVLDQGYWPEGNLTAPSDEAFCTDIRLSKDMGFNGCRKHQKVEDPRFLYWADRMGFLVWGEMSASCIYTNKAAVNLTNEWMEVIKRDYNHPCIVAWVPLNESWGVSQIAYDYKQQQHSLALYHLIKSLDPTRLVVNNDGWEMTKTDICGIHNYAHGQDNEREKKRVFKEVLSSKELLLTYTSAGRKIYASGFEYEGEPILLTEFGGIAYNAQEGEGWGYSVVNDGESYLKQLEEVLSVVIESNSIYGFCYTQLTDVEQEINGLLTYDRKPKVELEKIREIITKWRSNRII